MSLRVASILVFVVALCAIEARARPIISEASESAWWLITQRAPVRNQLVSTPQPWGDVRRLDLETAAWVPVISITREPLAAACVDDRLAILFDDGTWSLAWPGTLMPGPPFPAQLTPVAVAGEASTLWFLARTGRKNQDESDGASPEAQSGQLWLVSYSKAEFSDPIPLTDESFSDRSTYSIARFAQGEFVIIQRDDDGLVRWWRWSSDGLKPLSTAQTKTQTARAIAGFGKPAGFAITSDSRAQIFFDSGKVAIQSEPIFNHPNTDASIVRGEIRLVTIDQNTIRAQTLALDGTEKSKSAILPIGQPAHQGAWLMRLVMMGSLLPVLLWSFGQPPTSPMPVTVKPAPLHLRILASLIDAPFLLPGPVFASVTWIIKKTPPEAIESEMAFTMSALSMAAYLLYTTMFEGIVGRTPGKMILGLRVVRPDGSKPEPGRLIVRNLSRGIEIVIFPLLFAMLMPSRQRMGDLIASTIVVRDSTQNSESVNQSKPQDGQA